MTSTTTHSLLYTLTVHLGVIVLASAVIAGCAQSGDGPLAEGPLAFENSAELGNLTGDEWAAFKHAQDYVADLVPLHTPVSFNHADKLQRQFVTLRLKLAGKTPKNSPELFAQLKRLRADHERLGLQSGVLYAADNSAQHSTQHYFSSLEVLPDGDTQEVNCTLSSSDPATYSFADCATWDAAGTPIGNVVWTENYGSMPYTTLGTTGDLNLATVADLEADSYIYQDLASSFKSVFTRESYIRRPSRPGPRFESPAITAPVNTAGGACISVCLNRTWTNDCDYDLTGTPTALKLPLQGCVDLKSQSAGSYSFDPAKIAEYAAGTAQSGGKPDQGGQIRVVLADVGNGCNVDGQGGINASMKSFWQSVTLHNGDDRLCWDMTGANAMVFDNSCRQVQDFLELNMNLTLPWTHNNGVTGGASISVTNNPDAAAPDMDCIKVTNSCLAQGTLIELGDGRATPIEKISAGDAVYNPYHTRTSSLTVIDTAVGFETVPMVRIADDAGHSLLMTEMHPIYIVGRGMVQAKFVQVGDRVHTKAGPTVLTSVTRETFDGNVHNLKVGSEAEAQALGADQTVIYANGFMVGDGQIQQAYESLAAAAKKPATTGTPARRWRNDYKHSLKR